MAARGDDDVPGELKQKAAELDQALDSAKEAVLKEMLNTTATLKKTEAEIMVKFCVEINQ